MIRLPLCACGCRQRVRPPSKRHRFRVPTYIRGHHRRKSGWESSVPPDVPIGICECGCGGITPIAQKTYAHLRRYKGHPLPIINGHRMPLRDDAIRRLTREEAAYLAGIVDGEGCIYIMPASRRSVRVSVANTDVHLIDWLQQIGGTTIRNRTQIAPRKSRKTVFSWGVSSWRSSRDVLVQIEPFMIIKKDKARDALKKLHHWLNSSQTQ